MAIADSLEIVKWKSWLSKPNSVHYTKIAHGKIDEFYWVLFICEISYEGMIFEFFSMSIVC